MCILDVIMNEGRLIKPWIKYILVTINGNMIITFSDGLNVYIVISLFFVSNTT